MKAYFTKDNLFDKPDLIVEAETEVEWRALQLWLELVKLGKMKYTVAYTPPEKSNAEIPPEDNPFAE